MTGQQYASIATAREILFRQGVSLAASDSSLAQGCPKRVGDTASVPHAMFAVPNSLSTWRACNFLASRRINALCARESDRARACLIHCVIQVTSD